MISIPLFRFYLCIVDMQNKPLEKHIRKKIHPVAPIDCPLMNRGFFKHKKPVHYEKAIFEEPSSFCS